MHVARYILIIAVLHDARPHFLRVPEPGAAGDVSLLLRDGCRARACRYIPVIEIWTMHRITTTSQNTDQDVISISKLVVSLQDDASNTPPILLPTNGSI